ncbi:MAG TPA: hypothetical protein VD846_11750 [Allosphingosinicella sp.]|nr:hypothetical protein [Allosphingosinicella sp.]
MRMIVRGAMVAGLMALGACNSSESEQAADNVEAVAGNQSDALDEAADNAATENQSDALENEADAGEEKAENEADAIEDNGQ